MATTAERERKSEPLPHDADVERAVLALLLVSGRWTLIEQLDAADFLNPLHKFVFSELRLMMEAGEVSGDAHALTRWFRRPMVLQRGDGLMVKENVAFTLGDLGTSFALVAHEAYYVRCLRKERLRRALRFLAAAIERRDLDDPDRPVETLKWIHERVDELWTKAFDVFPEEMTG